MARFRIGDEPPKPQREADPNILSIKDKNKVRLVDAGGDGVAMWKQHTVKNFDDPDDNAKVKFVNCPGPQTCPLCRKPSITNAEGKPEQTFPMSTRYATNVWDYDTNSVKILISGPSVFNTFKEAGDVGLDPMAQDWIIHKTGSGLGTRYKVVRDNPSPFEFAAQVTPETLLSLDKYEATPSPEKIFEILDQQGWDYDAIEAPSFTAQEALEFVMPYGKSVKGMTVEQAMAQDLDFLKWLHGAKAQDESFFDPVFVALDVALSEAGHIEAVDIGEATTAPAPSQSAAAAPPAQAEAEMTAMLDPAGNEVEVPAGTVTALQAAGYTLPPEPEPEQAAPVEDGKVALWKGPGTEVIEVENQEAMLKAMEDIGFSRVPAEAPAETAPEPEESAPTTPQPIAAGTAIHIKVNGTGMAMTFKAALDAVKAGLDAEWETPEQEAYAVYLISTGGEPPEKIEATQSQAEAAMHAEAQDPQPEPTGDDKPFKCQEPGCDWAGKTSGALTQHLNRVHAPQGASETGGADAPAAESNGAAAAEAPANAEGVKERIQVLLQKIPEDKYKDLLGIFERVAGTRDLSDFTDAQMLDLEKVLQEEIAA